MTMMMLPSLISGLSLLIACGCCSLRNMLLNPRADQWASAPFWYRSILFMFSVVTMFLGIRFLSVAFDGVYTVPPDATVAMSLLAPTIAFYEFGALYRTWHRESWSMRIARYLSRKKNEPVPTYILPGDPHHPHSPS